MNQQTRLARTVHHLEPETWISLVFAVLALAWFSAYPFFYDDAFISLRISRNMADGLGPFHNLEEKVQTNTSLLYPFLVAPFQLLDRFRAVQLNTAFDFLLGFLIVRQIWMALRQHSHYPKLPVRGKVVLAVWINLAFYANRLLVPGMETQLYMLVLLLTWNAFQQQKTYAFVLGFSCSFIRPEGALLAIIFWITGRWTFQARRISLLYGLALGMVYLSLQWYLFGNLIPHTIAVKAQIQPEPGHSLWHFVVNVLLPYRYPLVLLTHVLGIAYLAQHFRKSPYRTLSLFLVVYALVFCVLAGGNAFFGWYQSPLKLFLLLAAGWQCLEWWAGWEPKSVLISSGLFLATVPVLSEQVRYRQDGIFQAAKDLAQLTGGKSLTATCEPMGILGYFNPHIQFHDYPGLASGRSLSLLKAYGPIRRSTYFNNEAFRQIILQAQADLVLLSPPEARDFKELMRSPQFIYLGKIGREKKSEHNSAFYVWLNRTHRAADTEKEWIARAQKLKHPTR